MSQLCVQHSLSHLPSSQAVVRNLPRKTLPVQRHDENPAKPCEKGIYYCSRYCAQGVPGVSIRSDPARVESGLHGPRVDTASRRGASARSAPAHHAAGASSSRMNPARAHGTKDVCRACACRSAPAGRAAASNRKQGREKCVARTCTHACASETRSAPACLRDPHPPTSRLPSHPPPKYFFVHPLFGLPPCLICAFSFPMGPVCGHSRPLIRLNPRL